MTISLLIVLLFIISNGIVGSLVSPKKITNREHFSLAGRSLGGLLLFATMAATNFSAFTVFGLSGAGYRIGWAYYPAMAFGTGFMALSFILLGIPLYRLSKVYGWISPAQFVESRYNSRGLSRVYAFLIITITIPYVAIQARSGGILIQTISGIPFKISTALVVMLVMLYVFRGGMKSVVYTDILQLLMLVILSGTAFTIIGWGVNNAGFVERMLNLQDRSGANGSFPLISYISTMLLWFLADPMFPQLFQRFFSAKDEKALVKSAALYPLITGFLFFMTIGLGVFGTLFVPGLSPSESEQVFIKATAALGGQLVATVVSLAGLAALLSTLDSQLLSVSSISVETFFSERLRTVTTERLMVMAIALFGYLGALFPIKTILDFLSSTAFPAYAIMAPLFWGGLYSKRIGKKSAFLSLISGIGLVLIELNGWKPFLIPSVIFNVIIQIIVLIFGSLMFDRHIEKSDIAIPLSSILSHKQLLVFAGIFLLSIDFWNFGRPALIIAGIPLFVWYSMGLCGVLSIAIWWQYRKQ